MSTRTYAASALAFVEGLDEDDFPLSKQALLRCAGVAFADEETIRALWRLPSAIYANSDEILRALDTR